jgi:hypothetical protein
MKKQIKHVQSKIDADVDLLKEIRELIAAARNAVIRNINSTQVFTSFEIGRRIVEHEQQGENRAD